MAKTQDEPAGASGSQFFVVTGDGAASLPPDYALLGKVTERHGGRDEDRRASRPTRTARPPPRS